MKIRVCLILFSTAVSAAPMLRLSNSVVTVHAAVRATAASQTLQAFNAGDGTLSLSVAVTPAISWLALSILPPLTCPAYFNGSCNPIQFTFTSAGLAPGSYTARVTLSDPNAIDSPQVVIVTLFVGDPQAIEKYVAPGTTTDVPFPSSTFTGCFWCPLEVSTANGGGWLSVVLAGAGTFYYDQSIRLAPSASLAPGTYTGNIANLNNPVVQNIPVIMHVTTLPIAVPSTNQISLQLAQNGPATTYPFLPYISLTNSGMGTLEVTGVSGSGTGVSAYNYNALAIVTVDPGSLAPGTYTDGMVTIQCNGANCPVQIPVTLEVDPQGPPIVTYQRVQDNATFATTGSPGDVMVVKGTQLSFEAPQTASGTPLPTTLGGASVLVNGVATPLFYSSFGQIAFQARADTYLGTALVQVVRDGQFGNTVSVNMAQYAPGIVVVTDASYNVVDATHPVKAGSTLVFWALGLGPTNPVVADGTASPSSPPALVTAQVAVQFGLEFFYNTTTPSFVGLSPGSVGLYQVIATLPASTPAGTVSASLQLPGGQLSNTVTIAVQ
jgi:uncharacterized protein (TIGR03437 family)